MKRCIVVIKKRHGFESGIIDSDDYKEINALARLRCEQLTLDEHHRAEYLLIELKSSEHLKAPIKLTWWERITGVYKR